MVIEEIYRAARATPQRTAVIFNGVAFSYAAFSRAIGLMRDALSKGDLPAGKTAGIVIAGNLLECWALNIAARSLGANTIVAPTLKELIDLDPPSLACVFATEREKSEGRLNVRQPLPCPTRTLANISFDGVFEGPIPRLEPGPGSYGGHYLYSSGTTGARKKLFFDAALEKARAAARCRALSLSPGNVHHNMLMGLWSGNGWRSPIAHWYLGGTVIFEQRKEDIFDLMAGQEFDSTTLSLPHLKRLAARSNADVFRKPGCRIFSGNGLASKSLFETLLARIPRSFLRNYGSTELAAHSLITCVNTPDDLGWYAPTPGKEVQIVDDSDRVLPGGHEGHIRIRLTELDATGYVDDPEATSLAFRDGYFYPGDRAVARSDGRIRILGRVSDVINIQGRKVSVAPIEQDLQRHFDVSEVCVFSHINREGHEELVIALEAPASPPAHKLQEVVKSFSMFERVQFAIRSKFPRTETGGQKVRRLALKETITNGGA